MTDFYPAAPGGRQMSPPSPGVRGQCKDRRQPAGRVSPRPMPHRMRPRLWRAASGRRGVRCAGPLRWTAKPRRHRPVPGQRCIPEERRAGLLAGRALLGPRIMTAAGKPCAGRALQPGTSSASTLRHLPGKRPPAGCWRRRGSPWRALCGGAYKNGEMLDSCIYALVREEAP